MRCDEMRCLALTSACATAAPDADIFKKPIGRPGAAAHLASRQPTRLHDADEDASTQLYEPPPTPGTPKHLRGPATPATPTAQTIPYEALVTPVASSASSGTATIPYEDLVLTPQHPTPLASNATRHHHHHPPDGDDGRADDDDTPTPPYEESSELPTTPKHDSVTTQPYPETPLGASHTATSRANTEDATQLYELPDTLVQSARASSGTPAATRTGTEEIIATMLYEDTSGKTPHIDATLQYDGAAGDDKPPHVDATLQYDEAAGDDKPPHVDATLQYDEAAGDDKPPHIDATLQYDEAAGDDKPPHIDATLQYDEAAGDDKPPHIDATLQYDGNAAIAPTLNYDHESESSAGNAGVAPTLSGAAIRSAGVAGDTQDPPTPTYETATDGSESALPATLSYGMDRYGSGPTTVQYDAASQSPTAATPEPTGGDAGIPGLIPSAAKIELEIVRTIACLLTSYIDSDAMFADCCWFVRS